MDIFPTAEVREQYEVKLVLHCAVIMYYNY